MDDMNAFEHQIASVVQQTTRSPRPVDVMSIVRTTTATQGPTWRFQSMFSATKFVVAGAIVALFGGLLLTGVMTQPSDERVLPVGASASATTRAEPTVDATTVGDPSVRSEALVVDVIDLPPAAGIYDARLLSTPDAVWLVGENHRQGQDGPTTATRIDKESLEVTDVVAVGGSARTAVIADGSLWQKQGSGKNVRLVETDLSNGEIRNEYPMPASVNDYPDLDTKAGLGWYWATVIDGAIWGWGFHDQLTRFDLAEREFTTVLEHKRFPVLHGRAYNRGYCCVATDDAIWLTNPDIGQKHKDLSIRRFDVATLEITDALTVDFPWGPSIAGISEGVFIGEMKLTEHAVGPAFVAIHRIDPVARAITEVIDVSPDADIGGAGVHMDGGIWMSSGSGGTVSRIDVASGAITHTVDFGTRATGAPLAFDDAIWIPNGDRAVTRIEAVAAAE